MQQKEISFSANDMSQITEAQTAIRWLYDVRDRVFRYYMLFMLAALGAIGLGPEALEAWEYILLLTIMTAVSALFLWQILKQRFAIDQQKYFIAQTSDGSIPIPPLYRMNTKQQVLLSSTMWYVWFIAAFTSVLLGASAVGVVQLVQTDAKVFTMAFVATVTFAMAFGLLGKWVYNTIPAQPGHH